jgi:3-oxoacyl-(acyl-carrier-protein) synthase
MALLETLDVARARGADLLFEVVGTGQATSLADGQRAFDHVSDLDPVALAHAVRQALDDAEIDVDRVGTVVSLARDDEGQVAAERTALESLGARVPQLQFLHPKRVLGESFGASECLGLLYAQRHARPTRERPYVLLNGHQVGGGLSVLVLRRPEAHS